MTLPAGTRLGPYEITASLGAGGMGEVYKARDTRLERDVAVKVLSAETAATPQLRERFDREARAVAALHHPHICTLHDVGHHDGIDFLVMEYLEGQTLARRLGQGPLPLDEALITAIQVAAALETAHRAGITHRDLKPANIMLTRAGAKLLDFGLAKFGVVPWASQSAMTSAPTRENLTQEGTILGTLQYMAPEQLEGRETDTRTDLFAFGTVLYEMITGRRAFEGQSQASLIAAILEREPPSIVSLQPLVAPALDRLVKRCLAKTPEERWQTATDLRSELQWIAGSEASSGTGVKTPAWRDRLGWIAAAVLLTALLAALAVGRGSGGEVTGTDPPTLRASILLPPGVRLWAGDGAGTFALSPDGRRFAFVAAGASDQPVLWVRALDTGVTQQLSGTDGAGFPFWSPDSRSLGFLAEGKLKRIEASGGVPLTLADAAVRATGAWNRDDVILFTPHGGAPLHRIAASGGTPSPVTALDKEQGDTQHWFPHFLPDQRHFLYFVMGSTTGGVADPRAVYVGSLESDGTTKLLVQGGSNAKYAQDHLLFLRDRTLMAQRFDSTRFELHGDPSPVADQVRVGTASDVGASGAFSVSDTGLLAYQAESGAARSRLVWFDRSGRKLDTLGDETDYGDLALDPKGERLAVSLLDPARHTRDLWVYDIARRLRSRFTFDASDEIAPVWSPDGERLAYTSGRQGGFDLYQRPSSGVGADQLLLQGDLGRFAASWSPDGRYLLYVYGAGVVRRSDLWALPLFGDGKAFPVLDTPFVETQGRFSPDGRWIAYASNDSGRFEVYVTAFPGPGRKWQVSSGGGGWPRWRRDGRELYYIAADRTLTAVQLKVEAGGLDVSPGQSLFTAPLRPHVRLDAYSYDVTPDGQRFLLNTAGEEVPVTAITLVLNWTTGLRKSSF